MRAVATQSILAATLTLRDSVERDVSPATQRLAKRMADQLVVSLVEGLEGPLQDRLPTEAAGLGGDLAGRGPGGNGSPAGPVLVAVSAEREDPHHRGREHHRAL